MTSKYLRQATKGRNTKRSVLGQPLLVFLVELLSPDRVQVQLREHTLHHPSESQIHNAAVDHTVANIRCEVE